jgi:ribonuclease HIII
MSEYYTFNLNLEQIKTLQKHYQEYNISHNNNKIIQVFKKNDIKITFFKKGTCLIQGKNIKKEIYFIKHLFNIPIKKTFIAQNFSSNNLSYNNNASFCKNSLFISTNNIGLDEVGTGDVFGPIVVCSTLVTQENITFLKEIGIKDSKKLSSQQIFKMVPLIIQKIPYRFQILSLQEYNILIQNNNLNKIKALLHNNNILEFLKELPNKKYPVILDQFASPKNYFTYLEKEKEVFRSLIFETQSESKYLSVALASIIARYIFLKEMKTLNNVLQMELKLGASKLVDEQISFIYQNKGLEILKKISKNNFRNIKNYLK